MNIIQMSRIIDIATNKINNIKYKTHIMATIYK